MMKGRQGDAVMLGTSVGQRDDGGGGSMAGIEEEPVRQRQVGDVDRYIGRRE